MCSSTLATLYFANVTPLHLFAGAFPTWLSPEQVRVLTISEKTDDFARDVFDQLKAAGIRASLDDASEKIGAKIRSAQLEKIPYMLVIGQKEAEANSVSVRHRSRGAGSAGPATGCGIGHRAAAPCLSPSVCHGRLVSAKICMRLETPVAVRALQARPDTPTRSCGPGHCTHKPEQGVDQNRNCHGHSVACH